MNLVLFTGLLLGTVPPAAQTAPPQPTVTFIYENPALEPAHYTLTIHADGSGSYQAQPGSAASSDPNGLKSAAADRPITLDHSLRKQLFEQARKQHYFATRCDAKSGKIAFSGAKTLRYSGPTGSGSCTFNYSRNAQLNALASSLEAVAETLEEGRKLQLLLAHDKLGLDAELDRFSREYADGAALDLQNIAPILREIADNDEVLNHSRGRARTLLEQAGQTR